MAYQEPTALQKQLMEDVEVGIKIIRDTLRCLDGSRCAAVALTQLETAEMWANKAIVKGDAQ